MAGEIATAFVRIRPNMAGFQAETESGVKKAFSGLAEAVGLAFGAAEAFHFGKEVVTDASNLQHQIENIRVEFGRASAAVLDFGSKTGASLGVSENLADTTASRLGVLFQSLGIGQGAAAQMTVGLEKLGASLASIRGINPATVFSQLPYVLSGNVRVLKSMGLAIDQTQLKFAAFKLGLIANVNQGLTPAVKAEAIYALATANLGKLQQQAAAHSGDLANVQSRLSAEWSNAKDLLGKALLPEFTRLAGQLESWLSRMEKSGRLQADFNAIGRTTVRIVKGIADAIGTGWRVWQAASGWIGGTKNAVVLLFSVLTVNKIRTIAGSIVTDLVNNGFKKVGAASEEARAKAVQSFGTMGLAARGLALTIKEALISTAIGALVVAIGLVTTYVITHWDYVRAYTVQVAKNMAAIWHGFALEVKGEMNILAGAINTALTAPLVGFTQLASKALGWVPFVGKHIKNAAKDVLDFSEKVGPGLVGIGIKNIKQGGQQITDALYASASSALAKTANDNKTLTQLHDLGTKMGATVNDGVVKEIAQTPAKIATSVSDAMKAAIAAANQRIAQSIAAAKDNLDRIGGKLADSVNKILDKLSPNGPAGTAQREAIAKLQKLIQSGAPGFAITRAAQELSTDLQSAGKNAAQTKSARQAAVKQSIADLTDEFNRGKIGLSTFNKELTALLVKDKVSYKVAGKSLGTAFADGFKSEVAGLREQAKAIAAVPEKLRASAGGGGGGADVKIIRPLEVINREQRAIAVRAEKQRAQQIKAQERAAKAAEKIASNTAQTKAAKVGKLPGQGTKEAQTSAQAGVKP